MPRRNLITLALSIVVCAVAASAADQFWTAFAGSLLVFWAVIGWMHEFWTAPSIWRDLCETRIALASARQALDFERRLQQDGRRLYPPRQSLDREMTRADWEARGWRYTSRPPARTNALS